MTEFRSHFNEIFDVEESVMESYGAFNISLINDLPLFIDPFLLFASSKEEYQSLHKQIIEYLVYLRDRAIAGNLDAGATKHLCYFSEIKQTWLGFSEIGNSGLGLGNKFATSIKKGLQNYFTPQSEIFKSEHIEKLCILQPGIGRDFVSDFTTNLIHDFLLTYTQEFAVSHIAPKFLRKVSVSKAIFNPEMGRWLSKEYTLPWHYDDYVILTPRDILTKDETWINSNDLAQKFSTISESIPNEQLRSAINEYFQRKLPPVRINPKTKREKAPSSRERSEAIFATIERFPQIADYYVKEKEETGDEASSVCSEKVAETEIAFVSNAKLLIKKLSETAFYQNKPTSYAEALARVSYLKHVIEDNDGYLLFYMKGTPIKREKDLHILYRLTWYAASHDVNAEVNNGRGPVDYKVSKGSQDSTLVEFKLASNSKLRQNLENQVEVYEAANQTKHSIKVILYFSENEFQAVKKIIKDLKLEAAENIILIDASKETKTSASNVKSAR